MADGVGADYGQRLGQPGIASGRLLFEVSCKGDFPRGQFTLRLGVGQGFSQDIQAFCQQGGRLQLLNLTLADDFPSPGGGRHAMVVGVSGYPPAYSKAVTTRKKGGRAPCQPLPSLPQDSVNYINWNLSIFAALPLNSSNNGIELDSLVTTMGLHPTHVSN